MTYNKAEFEKTARKYITRKGIEEILSMLAASDFYTAPASTQYHDSHKGGLCKHSLRVWEELSRECGLMFSPESIAIVSLFHDLCKIGYYKETTRNVKNEVTGSWEKQPFYKVEDQLPLGHGEKSLILIMSKMELTVEEMMAIRWHMNGFEPKENYPYISKAYGEFPLALFTHLADMKATYLKVED